MKSQDILILLKLICLEEAAQLNTTAIKMSCKTCNSNGLIQGMGNIHQKCPECHGVAWITPITPVNEDWQGWDEFNDNDVDDLDTNELTESATDKYTARFLSKTLGISKSEINNSIKRSIAVGLAKFDRETGHPKTNITALRNFIVYSVKYVFPAKTGGIIRGIPTSFAAPILKGQLMTAGDTIYVWPDPRGKNKGQMVAPLYKSVPQAVKFDSKLYEFLALIDAIRLGLSRETKLAENILEKILC